MATSLSLLSQGLLADPLSLLTDGLLDFSVSDTADIARFLAFTRTRDFVAIERVTLGDVVVSRYGASVRLDGSVVRLKNEKHLQRVKVSKEFVR